MRRIIRCLLVCLLMLGLLPKSVYADTTYNLTLQGEKAYNMAYEILTLVNQERAKVGAAALQMDTTQLEAAMQRAAECHILYDHTRPDGTKCFTALPTPPGGTSRSENITTGGNSSTAQDAVDSWMGSAAHKEALLSTKYKSTGIGVFYYNGRYMFTEFFSSQTANVPARKYNTSATMTVKANDTRLGMITMHLTSPTIPVGGSSSAQLIMGNYRDTVLNPSDFTYTSSNTAVATVSSGGLVKGVKKGTVTITAYLKGSGKSWTTSITVDNGVVINETNFPDIYMREYVSRYQFDPDQNGYLSETELGKITWLFLTEQSCSSLKGIEFFPNLEQIEITKCTMTNISLTGMTKLKTAIISGTGPVSIVISNCPLLEKLTISNNTALKQLSVTNCASLEVLVAEWLANLEILQLQKVNKLFNLSLAYSGIKTVNVSSIPLLNTAVTKGTSYTHGNYYPERVSYSYQYSIGDMVYDLRVPTGVTVISSGGRYMNGEPLDYAEISFSSGVSYRGSTPYVLYNGNARTPAITVKNKVTGQTISPQYYTVSYTNNKNPGTAQVTVTLKGSYSGTATTNFKIYLPATANTFVENASNGIHLTWSPVKGAKGYVIYRRAWNKSSSGWTAFERWNNTTSTQWTDTKVYAGTRYQYGVKAYYSDPMDNYNLGEVGPLKTTVRITTRTLKTLTPGSGQIAVTWDPSSVFTGYQVKYATDSSFSNNMKSVKVKNPSRVFAVIRGLSGGTTYYFSVRSYQEFDGMTYFGGWSNVKSGKPQY